jgi:chaperonin GroEL (HSP60 family)
MGDATNTVLILAGELLKKAENLLIMGLHPSEVIKGYELACTKALTELESAWVPRLADPISLKSTLFTSVID